MTFSVTRRLALGLAAATSLALSAPALAQSKEQQLVDDSAAVLSGMLADGKMSWLRDHIGKAKGIMITPKIVKAGFIVGGSGGHGVLLLRGQDGRWLGPSFYNMSTANIGFQAGVSSGESVTLVMTDRAVDKLMSGSVKLGGDMTIATGPVGGGTKTNIAADFVTFGKAKGLYGGVNVGGSVVSPNEGMNKAFWGTDEATPMNILIRGTIPPNPGAAKLINLVSYEGKR